MEIGWKYNGNKMKAGNSLKIIWKKTWKLEIKWKMHGNNIEIVWNGRGIYWNHPPYYYYYYYYYYC